jgi:MFS family permease
MLLHLFLSKSTLLTLSKLALFVAALDQTIVSTALPTIASELHSASGYTWVGSAYLLANAAAAPIWAKLSDIWGRKLILLVSVAWFFVSSIICATAPSMSVLIAGRALQGVGGGALIQVTIITISDLFSMRLRTLFIGLMEFMWALAGGIGPIVGGVFSESVSWRCKHTHRLSLFRTRTNCTCRVFLGQPSHLWNSLCSTFLLPGRS